MSYLSIKRHFTSKTYDYFKYKGRVKTSHQLFEKRPDKYHFYKLAQRKNNTEFLVANFAYGNKQWIGDLIQNVEAEENFTKFMRVKQSLTYTYTQDLSSLLSDFSANFKVKDGQHPPLLKKYLRKEIHLETLSVLETLLGFCKTWSNSITDTVVWPDVAQRCIKLKPFLDIDKSKMKKITVDFFKQ